MRFRYSMRDTWWASNLYGGAELAYHRHRLVGADALLELFRTCSEAEFRVLFARWFPSGDVERYIRRLDHTTVFARGVLARRVASLAAKGEVPGVTLRPALSSRAQCELMYGAMLSKYRKPFYRAKLLSSSGLYECVCVGVWGVGYNWTGKLLARVKRTISRSFNP